MTIISFLIFVYIIHSKGFFFNSLHFDTQNLKNFYFIAIFDCNLVKATNRIKRQLTENYNILWKRKWEGSCILSVKSLFKNQRQLTIICRKRNLLSLTRYLLDIQRKNLKNSSAFSTLCNTRLHYIYNYWPWCQ